MAFLRSWLTRWRHSPADELLEAEDDQVVARFVLSSRLRWKEGGFKSKPAAFLPRTSPGGRLETSVFRVNGLGPEGIWDLARKHVVPAGRRVHGRADIATSVLESTAPPLSVEIDNVPPRHGNLVNWPPEPDDQLAVAQELAERAVHYQSPDS